MSLTCSALCPGTQLGLSKTQCFLSEEWRKCWGSHSVDPASSCQFPKVASQLMSPLLLPGPLWTTPQSSWSLRSVGGHLLPLCSCGASRPDLEFREGEFLPLCPPPTPESQSGTLCLASSPNPGPRLSLGFPMSKSMAPPHRSQTNPFPPLRLC